MRRAMIASAGATVALAGGLMTATPASAAPLITAGGLVNVTIVDAVDVENVQVAAADVLDVAANVCGVTIGVVAQDLATDGTCTNANGDSFTINQRQR